MSIVETSKVVYELAKKGITIELQEKLMDLREEALNLQQENLELRKENLKLKEQIEKKEKIKFIRKVYFKENDETPYCPYCYEKSETFLHLTGPQKIEGNAFLYNCLNCGATYRTVENEDFTLWSCPRKNRM